MFCVVLRFLFYLGVVHGHLQREFYVDWENDRFVKDGAEFQYLSGGMHYFRIPHQYWEHRIKAAKSAGLNAIQTYVAWNVHEPEPGHYNFNGDYDLVKFIKLVESQDMVLILRVGPYICGEWNFGGLPPWLLGKTTQVRTTDPIYMAAVRDWINVLAPKMRPLLYRNGGPIVMVQVENEYGSFGCDHDYITSLFTLFREAFGEDVAYFTTDGVPGQYRCGSLPGEDILTTIDFGVGSDAAKLFDKLKKYQPRGPRVNSEFYTGWLDYWRHPHSTRPADKLGLAFDKLVGLKASVNFYMWHGGTSFGLGSGADTQWLWPNPTSYDYDAPQSEWGDVKLDKYWAIRNVTEKYFPGNKLPVPQDSNKLSLPQPLEVQYIEPLVSQLSDETHFLGHFSFPQKMEQLGVFSGIMAYQHVVKPGGSPINGQGIQVVGVHDRAYVLITRDDQNYQYIQVIKRDEKVAFVIDYPITKLIIMVENMGYIGCGKAMKDYNVEYKGMINVTVSDYPLRNWDHFYIDIANTAKWDLKQATPLTHAVTQSHTKFNGKSILDQGPAVVKATFNLGKSDLLDTFFNITEGWSKGYLIVNDVLVGRYWPDAGPQFTLFVPGVWLKEGTNIVYIVELQSWDKGLVEVVEKPYLNGPINPDA